eukprot:1161772-Pelagomonas_calceolata.AAC.7
MPAHMRLSVSSVGHLWADGGGHQAERDHPCLTHHQSHGHAGAGALPDAWEPSAKACLVHIVCVCARAGSWLEKPEAMLNQAHRCTKGMAIFQGSSSRQLRHTRAE